MSITSRSQSSSPDILGPPGDADYLISSPIKPFTGRQSWMSPAISRRQQTPAKRPRVSLSPAKSAHSIRFDDVLLPGSPTMKLNGRERSLSPEKIQQDGNLSPWRIRVTLEATQDEENQVQTSPSPKRRRPSTVTTMVPLKDERSPLMEKTPAKRKGRPRKSVTRPQNGSPWPGSPGNTPGPNEASAQKRKPGRPRKGTPKPKQQELLIADDALSPQAQSEVHLSPMDMTADGFADSRRKLSPINLAVNDGLDSDSLNADGLPIANLRVPPSLQREPWAQSYGAQSVGREYGRATYDTPIIGDAEHNFQDNDENIHSTPSKMPSPTRERLASSARSSRLAGNTSSPRTYPTPTPTSSLGEEDRARENQLDELQETGNQHPTSDARPDPTDVHEEFDSIMESEGFTMVSLDTLPSAKQYGLGSGTRNATDNASKILRDREDGRIGDRLKRKLPGINGLRSDSHSSARPSPVAQRPSPGSGDSLYPQLTQPQDSAGTVSYPAIPEISSPEKSQGRQSELYPIEEINDHQDEIRDDGDEAQEEQDEMAMVEVEEEGEEKQEQEEENQPAVLESPQLSERSPLRNSPTDLRRIRESEWQAEREIVSRHAADPVNAGRVINIESDEDMPQTEIYHEEALEDFSHPNAEPIFEEQRSDEGFVDEEPFEEERFDENPRGYVPQNVPEQFPSHDHDDGFEEEVLDEDNESVDIWQPEEIFISDPEVELETSPYQINRQKRDAEQAMLEDDEEVDGGFDDIWQQEARDHSQLSQHSDHLVPPSIQANSSPWRRITSSSVHQNSLSSSPAYVTMEHDDTRHLDQTHIRKLREQEVDLSAILAEEDTPNRARYYNGTSTPRSLLNRRPGAPISSVPPSAMKSASSRKSDKRVRLQPISQSPEPAFDAENDSPTTQQIPEPEPQPIFDGIHRNDDVSGSDIHATQSLREESVATPDHPRQENVEAEPSSWFKRITSLTPRWLKAPAKSRYDSSSDYSEDEQEDNHSDQDEPSNVESVQYNRESSRDQALSRQSQRSYAERRDESAGSSSANEDDHMSVIENGDEQFAEEEEPDDAITRDPVDFVNDSHDKLNKPRPLAVFGYFSDAHYAVLRRIYRIAKRNPDRFPYFDAPGRAEIIGDWIWTSDGHHGVPITEVQFAIIDRFVHELSHADIEYGGSGQVDWTEADLHRRLISVIIGEQIREEWKAKTVRGTSVDTWR